MIILLTKSGLTLPQGYKFLQFNLQRILTDEHKNKLKKTGTGSCYPTNASVSEPSDQLFHTLKNNDAKAAKRLLREFPDLVYRKDNFQMTPLHWAAINDDHKLAKFIIDKHPELVEQPDKFGKLPGDYAKSNNNERLVILLNKS